MSESRRDKQKGTLPSSLLAGELRSVIEQSLLESLSELVQRSFQIRREFLVSELVARFKQVGHFTKPTSDNSEWIGIDSLSRLRRVVGGRFQNIKTMWINCGFPMGSEGGQTVEVNIQAWVVLSSWIVKSGFEARLTPEGGVSRFELRKRKGK